MCIPATLPINDYDLAAVNNFVTELQDSNLYLSHEVRFRNKGVVGVTCSLDKLCAC